jgi:hypothetical protein
MNNIQFFLNLKLNLIDQIHACGKLIENYSNIDTATSSNIDEILILEKYLKLMNDNIPHVNNLKNLLELTETHIKNTCQHQMVDDFIDINAESVMYISYCKICEHTN